MKELLRKLSDNKNISIEGEPNMISSGTMVTIFKLLLIRSSNINFNKSNVLELINYSKDAQNQWCRVANELLELISNIFPDLFKTHVDDLVDLIINETPGINSSLSHTLRTIYHFIKRYPDLFPTNHNFVKVLEEFAINGSPKEAKYAVKILGFYENKLALTSDIFKKIYPLDLESKKFATHLSTIAELFLVDPGAVQDEVGELTQLLIKEVFLQNRNINLEALNDCTVWIDDNYLEENLEVHSTLYEKLLALRILINRLKSLASLQEDQDNDDITTSAQPVFKLLVSLIGNGGEIINKNSPTWPTPEVYKLKIRLVAGLLLLKIAKCKVYDDMVHPTTIRRLTFLLSDSNENVRRQFLDKLNSKLVKNLVSDRFVPIIFYSALEPNQQAKKEARMWINALFNRQDADALTFEKSLVRLIHLLAHDDYISDLTQDDITENVASDRNYVQAFTYAIKIITYYLDSIAKAENISLLYYLSSRVKQHRDAIVDSEEYEKDPPPKAVVNLYRIAELAQFVIKEYSDNKNWIIQTWPGKLKLPSDDYVQMGSINEVQNVITKVFIPERIQIELKSAIKKRLTGSTRRKGNQDSSASKKRPQQKQRKTKVKKARKAEDHEPTRKSTRVKSTVQYIEEDSISELESESEYSDY
jgi:sister-chromatid-cohesion protein PDS5